MSLIRIVRKVSLNQISLYKGNFEEMIDDSEPYQNFHSRTPLNNNSSNKKPSENYSPLRIGKIILQNGNEKDGDCFFDYKPS
jgi:hypothetical protein